MKHVLLTASTFAVAASGAFAGGIDRSGQDLGLLFEKGRVVELSFGQIMPTVEGTDLAGQPTGNVAKDYTQIGLSYKYDVTDRLSFAINLDQPFGADVEYGATSPLLGGTIASATSTAVTGLLRYKFNENFSVHAGITADRASASITLKGLAYGPVSGYNVDLATDVAPGYVLGVAYERPDIALRLALTYNSEIKHKFDTLETINGVPIAAPSVTDVTLPQSINFDFQSGIAANTLLFGQVRYVDWSAFLVDPAGFVGATGGGLIDLQDTVTYTLGVGRKFNDSWSGVVSVQYEKEGNPLVSPLAPTNGRMGVSLAAIYTVGNMKITTGINYTKVGDAQPETAAVARASMEGNTSVGVGIKVAYTF